jgi:hypothetical protein
MHIGTWNVEYATRKHNAQRIERMRAANCDVWVLTETHDDLVLGAGYKAVSTSLRVGASPGSRWTTIWTRYPIKEALKLADDSRTAGAVLSTPLGDLIVYGTVLPWHSDRASNPDAKNWSEHHRVIPEQGEEWKVLRGRYPEAGLCVAGDLNMSLGGKHYYGTKLGRELLQKALKDAELACVTEASDLLDTRLDHPPIDHVCVSVSLAARAKVIDAWNGTVARIKLSDHSAVVVEIEEDESGKNALDVLNR